MKRRRAPNCFLPKNAKYARSPRKGRLDPFPRLRPSWLPDDRTAAAADKDCRTRRGRFAAAGFDRGPDSGARVRPGEHPETLTARFATARGCGVGRTFRLPEQPRCRAAAIPQAREARWFRRAETPVRPG